MPDLIITGAIDTKILWLTFIMHTVFCVYGTGDDKVRHTIQQYFYKLITETDSQKLCFFYNTGIRFYHL